MNKLVKTIKEITNPMTGKVIPNTIISDNKILEDIIENFFPGYKKKENKENKEKTENTEKIKLKDN